jgi:hypothetical protein
MLKITGDGRKAALDADIAILGKKGRGKTFTAKGLVERLLQMQLGICRCINVSNMGTVKAVSPCRRLQTMPLLTTAGAQWRLLWPRPQSLAETGGFSDSCS